MTLIVAVLAAVVISAFCSLSEAALYSVPWSWIERLRKDGRASGELLFSLRTNVEKPITAILTLNTIANTAGAAIAGAAGAAVFGAEDLWFFTAAFTVLILAFGEILPKTMLGAALAIARKDLRLALSGAQGLVQTVLLGLLLIFIMKVDEINAAGGINGKKLEVVFFDDQCEPREAATVSTSIVNDPEIVGIVGHLCSSAHLAGLPAYVREGIPAITPTATSVAISDKNKDEDGKVWSFRNVYRDDFQGKFLADYIDKVMLEIADIETFYGNIQALKGVSLRIGQGEIVTLIGANGAGKTTTLMSISGVTPPRKGAIRFLGEDITRLSTERIVSLGITQVPEGRMKLELIEPLRELFKDEVRKVALELGLPDAIIWRHPFPGPGLAIRIIGEVTEERLEILRRTDKIVQAELLASGWYRKVWQGFAVLLPLKTVGVMCHLKFSTKNKQRVGNHHF